MSCCVGKPKTQCKVRTECIMLSFPFVGIPKTAASGVEGRPSKVVLSVLKRLGSCFLRRCVDSFSAISIFWLIVAMSLSVKGEGHSSFPL